MQVKNTRSLVFIIIFLLLTNIIMLCFLLLSRNGNSGEHGKDLNMVGTYLKDQVGFNEQQMNAYQKLRKDDFDHTRLLFQTVKSAKDSFYQNIYRQDVADSSLQKSAKVIGERQVTVDMQMLRHFKNIRSLCTSQQLPKFDSSFKNIVGKITSGRFRNNTRSPH